jgi:RNA polymerase sigma-70 factor, ECF subfamily
MSSTDSFDKLMDRLREGDDDAAGVIFYRFVDGLTARARQRLDSRLQAVVAPEDIVQSAFRSFFLRYAEGKFDLKRWNDLWGLLVVITLRKCGCKIKQLYGPRRNIGRQRSLNWGDSGSSENWAAIARDPTPAEAAALADIVEQLMEGLNGQERRICELRMQGFSVAEIAKQLGRTSYLVNVALDRIKKRLKDTYGKELEGD